MNKQQDIDEKYMRRCLQIAANGLQNAKPNPSVGAVIVAADGRIIGEGYTSAYGGAHGEVNAFASVKPENEHLLKESTIYVSLEPCSHHGKTPPCCDLIIRKGVKRVVCGCVDPFSQVQGRGIKRIREAGIEVVVGVLEKECIASNKRFITFNTHQRPYIILKWAQTADGFIGRITSDRKKKESLAISTPFTKMLVHKLRAENDAILIGRGTFETDKPQLNVREWTGTNPERLLLSASMAKESNQPEGWKVFANIHDALAHLYKEKKQSLIVEGGAETLKQFIAKDLWDEIRVETNPNLAVEQGVSAPEIPINAVLISEETFDGNSIKLYQRKE
ncbi:MAG: bifunctional diaminohydroxyphosphoribosylaminopyrimidine deaminase/5-amino-6-(5-phosphoribosylamino)uracil reductase RibD [Prevotella sp.]|nr:bifunctional diaminohydroxyphosphoribosylaminopyrimidine deaminase/5-amino-6-(5-phosphoribosylamino)uracil reductase RibD [Prevotella sp.]